ncbi:MAG: hypothetical protein H6Q49_197, partial [Deltaproteobacteria bacterium]|nr:hypothetical protein [Deltaproteobacteria bacterium]
MQRTKLFSALMLVFGLMMSLAATA